MPIDPIDYGKDCLLAEAEAIKRTAQRLDDSFTRALDCLVTCTGRVVLTGLGKSGHIARKISATFSSTGTPSFFLHPAEALHGDFGLLQKNDVLLAIAFGGETHEVNTVCRHAEQMQIKVVVITGKLHSTLATLAHIVLDGTIEEEACPLGLAPTSSAIVALALGDALAAALMKRRDFTAKQFALLHPGGTIGRRFMQVSTFVCAPGTVSPDADFFQVLTRVSDRNHGITAVVDEGGNLCGAITDGDVRRALTRYRSEAFALDATALMTTNPHTISPTTLVTDAIAKMQHHEITALFVQLEDTNRVVGIVRLHDLMVKKC